MIKDIKTFTIVPKSDKIDVEGLTRQGVRIIPSKLDDDYYIACRDITRNQYRLPIKYLKPINQSFRYMAKKSTSTKPDIEDADLVCEPLNPDIKHCISYTPINQDLPIGTIFYIDESIPYNQGSIRYLLSSDNLRSTYDKKLKGIYTKPFVKCDYNCSMDIGSEIFCKFEVEYIDPERIKSMTMFTGPRRSESPKDPFFEILVYKCWNRTPLDLFKLMKSTFDKEGYEWSEQSQAFIDEIIDKLQK